MTQLRIENSFDDLAKDNGREGWRNYIYPFPDRQWAVPKHERKGGHNNGANDYTGDLGFIWNEYEPWNIDKPEEPSTVLAFIYSHWAREDQRKKTDLRGQKMSVCLRGDDLNLDGAEIYFWVVGYPTPTKPKTRWHKKQALILGRNEWVANDAVLSNDETQWHKSWHYVRPEDRCVDPSLLPGPNSLDAVLNHPEQWGFSFFRADALPFVTGRFCIDNFSLTYDG